MKKFLMIGIALVMVLSATAAMAAVDNDWLINFKASTDALAKSGASNAVFGLKTASGDTFATLGTPANLSGSPEVNYGSAAKPYTSNYGVTGGRTYIAKLGGAKLGTAGNEVMDWTFRLAGAANASVYFTAWNATGATSQIDAGTTQTIKLYESNAAGEKIGDAVWTFQPGKVASWTSTGGIVGTANVDYFSKSYTLGAVDAAGGAYQYFVLEASTVPVNNTPEPGSMLAMLSGLVGLVGFGIRRRK